MNTLFSSRLAALRKERGLSQKEAAAALGISGALLSHYENGIRECGLSFLCKAAAYYDVSCDYLLGVSDTRQVASELLNSADRLQDGEFRLSTLFRAASRIGEMLVDSGEVSPVQIQEYFSIGIYRMILHACSIGVIPKDWIHLPAKTAFIADNAALYTMFPYVEKAGKRAPVTTEKPLCVETAIERSEDIMQKLFSSFTEEA